MKIIGLLTFLFLLTPGSGQLAWDGLPFSTRTEFVSLVLFVVAMASSGIRRGLTEILNRFQWRVLLPPILLMLCLLKLFTFTLSPLSEGFGACYRSLYEPLKDSDACEKSFEAPFLQSHGLVETKISRVDSRVDFGDQMFDWRLPFMNESNRFQVLWLSRFPFTVSYHSSMNITGDDQLFLPIRAIGEVDVSLDGKRVAAYSNYERHFFFATELVPGRSDLRVNFRYSDDDTSRLPESAPPPRGPYAQLKIGEPLTVDQLVQKSRILIFGEASSEAAKIRLDDIAITNRFGQKVFFNDERENQAGDASAIPGKRQFDFEISLDANALADGPLNLVGSTRGGEIALAKIQRDETNMFALEVSQEAESNVVVSALFTIDRDRISALSPGTKHPNSFALGILFAMLDSISLLTTLLLAFAILIRLRSQLVISAIVAALAWTAVNPLYNSLPSFLGGGRELVIPYALVAIMLVMTRFVIVSSPLALLLPTSAVLATQKVFDHLYFNHPGEGNNWWGKLIYMWRDSDWYVNHGNARAVFVESFLRGGESVFWARTGPRYLIFLGQFFLGENDILLGLISVTVGFLVLFYLTAQFSVSGRKPANVISATAITFIGMIFLGDQIITAFGFLITSEYTTWIGLLGLTAFLISREKEQRVWLTTLMAAFTAILIHFRPNIVFVGMSLLFLILMKSRQDNPLYHVRQVVYAITAFFAILPISLLHNLYYGGRFVPFTENNASTVAIHKRFSWISIWREMGFVDALALIWQQTRVLMYWGSPDDPNLAIIFWGSQLTLGFVIVTLVRTREIRRPQTLISLLPLTYIVPMASYKLESYYPRHIVTASLLCLCSAMIIWPRDNYSDELPTTTSAVT